MRGWIVLHPIGQRRCLGRTFYFRFEIVTRLGTTQTKRHSSDQSFSDWISANCNPNTRAEKWHADDETIANDV